MNYYTDLFSPETYRVFNDSNREVTGFSVKLKKTASQIKPGDRLVCYVTKVSRWIGILEVTEQFYEDDTPLFHPEIDPYVVRFHVKVHVWLPMEKAIPIHTDKVWDFLSFTKNHKKNSKSWTGKVRKSLTRLSEHDGKLLEQVLANQCSEGETYELTEDDHKKLTVHSIRRVDKAVSVSIPEKDETAPAASDKKTLRESYKMQALLAKIGEVMGFKVWIPNNDRSNVLKEWMTADGVLLDVLPLNYDVTTMKTIEQIDVLWLKGGSIVRAFEVEHSTAVYSGILRMADLLALLPNMDIRLHIIAPVERKEKVLQEINRPVFSLLERAPLSEICTYVSYDSIKEISTIQHLSYTSDDVLDEFTEDS